MNIVKKIYCRAFQIALRAALPILPYRKPSILCDVSEIVAVLEENAIRSVLLVTDRGLRERGITSPLERLLRDRGIACAVYDRTQSNPTVENVEEARDLYISSGCEAIIAFGGGSPMDCAKVVGARIVYPHKSVRRMRGILRVMRSLPPLFVIPTTAGSGSEATLTAVVTSGDMNYKYPINSFSLIPHYAVHDPSVTYSLPPRVTATTGMDALTHAVEVYIGRSTSRETRRCALEATALIFANIERAYTDGQDRKARANMLRAAYLAGIGVSKSYVGYAHAVAHSLGGQYDIPHGLANAVLLPIVLDEYGRRVYHKLHRLAVAAGVAVESDTPETGARKMIAAIRELNRRLGIPETLPDIRREDIPLMAHHADEEANPLYPVPVLMDAGELERFYDKVADWSEDRGK